MLSASDILSVYGCMVMKGYTFGIVFVKAKAEKECINKT